MSNSTNYKPLLIVRSVGKNVPYISARGTPVAISKQVMLTLYFKTGDAEPNELPHTGTTSFFCLERALIISWYPTPLSGYITILLRSNCNFRRLNNCSHSLTNASPGCLRFEGERKPTTFCSLGHSLIPK